LGLTRCSNALVLLLAAQTWWMLPCMPIQPQLLERHTLMYFLRDATGHHLPQSWHISSTCISREYSASIIKSCLSFWNDYKNYSKTTTLQILLSKLLAVVVNVYHTTHSKHILLKGHQLYHCILYSSSTYPTKYLALTRTAAWTLKCPSPAPSSWNLLAVSNLRANQ